MIKKAPRETKPRPIPRILLVLLSIVGGMWLLSTIADIWVPTYDPTETIGLAFMAVLSPLLGIIAASQRVAPDDDHDKEDDEDS